MPVEIVSELPDQGICIGAIDGARCGQQAYAGASGNSGSEARTDSTLVPYQFTGGLYGAVAPGPDKEYGEPGTWNRYEVLYRGSRLAAALNGRLLFDVDTHGLEVEPAFAARACRSISASSAVTCFAASNRCIHSS